MKFVYSILASVAALLSVACGGPAVDASNAQTVEPNASPTGECTSGTIVYNVYLKPESSADEDGIYFTQDFNREAFVDSIFASIYYHRAVVTDVDGTVLSIDEIRSRELEDPERYGRDKVAGIQFTEQWTFDPASHSMCKEVKKMLVGYEVVEEGARIALRPGFVINY